MIGLDQVRSRPAGRQQPFSGNGTGRENVDRTMLFYQFTVSRQLDSLVPSEAKVMVRVDSDVERSTGDAVNFLHELGWNVAEVRHARLAETIDEFSHDSTLLELYQDADREGIACVVGGTEFTSKLTSDSVRSAF